MSNLLDYIGELRKVMLKLTDLRKKVATRGETRMADWLQMVEDKEVEMGNIETEWTNLEKSWLPRPVERDQLVKRVRKNITAVEALIKRKDEISKEMEKFMSEVATGQPTKFSEELLKKYTSNFVKQIGSGDLGIVYKGVLPYNNVKIAVKVIMEHSTGMDNMEKQFKAEVNTMIRTSHRNLAKLYGYCFDPKKKALVYEYVENSLDKVLYDSNSGIEWGTLYKIAIDTAKGLSYLHENCDVQIIHRDIKASNVLLDSKFCPKLTDFGLAKLCAIEIRQTNLTPGFNGGRHYDAPEFRTGNNRTVSNKCDVFSFGVMLFEFLLRKKCDVDTTFVTLVWDKFQNGQLDEFITTECGIGEKDKENAKTLSLVALLCIETTPQDRPSMSEVVNILMNVIKQPSTPRNPFLTYYKTVKYLRQMRRANRL